MKFVDRNDALERRFEATLETDVWQDESTTISVQTAENRRRWSDFYSNANSSNFIL